MTTDPWVPICDLCKKPLTEPGAVILYPPRKDGTCKKEHQCVSCFTASREPQRKSRNSGRLIVIPANLVDLLAYMAETWSEYCEDALGFMEGDASDTRLRIIRTVRKAREYLPDAAHETCGPEPLEPTDAALDLVRQYGGIDGAHHKQWVIDQVVRVLTGDQYEEWVHAQSVDRSETYEWDIGTPP